MRSTFLVLFFISTIFHQGLAQDPLADYKTAKNSLQAGSYKEAMDLLRPFMNELEFGDLSGYASFHFAKAAQLNGQATLAASILEPILSQSKWSNNDEAKYLMSLIYFEQNKNSEALALISKIKTPEIYAQAENASFHYLQQASLSSLMGFLKTYSENKGFMQALKSQMDKQTVMSSEERTIYSQLRSELNTKSVSKNRQNLDIAIILPFNYSGGSGVRSISNGNFIFEMYQGIDFGIQELRRNGLMVNVKTYDTERKTEKVKAILADPYLQEADVIIGPIYPEETDLVMAFAENKQIPFINPLSNIDDRLHGKEFAYLFRPSISSISQGVMDYARRNISGKRLAIAYSTATKDELLAKEIEKLAVNNGYTIVRNDKISGRDVLTFFERIQLRSDAAVRADLVIILSDDPNIGSPALGFMESQNIRTPVLVMDSWLFFNFANYEMLESQNFHFISNNTLRLDGRSLEPLREEFYAQYMNYPSQNTLLGYELAYWIAGTINSREGFDFRRNLDKKGYTEGKISYGQNFGNSFNNKFVPVFKLEKGILEVK